MQFNVLPIFLIPLYIAFLSPKILSFLFTTKNSLTWGVKSENSNFRKSIVADLLEKLRNLYMNEYRKQSLGAPAILAFSVEIWTSANGRVRPP